MNKVTLSPRTILAGLLGILALVAAVSFGSFALPEKTLVARRGALAAIPRDTRRAFIARRTAIGSSAGIGFLVLSIGWLAAEQLARRWQKHRNLELANNAVLLKLSPREEDKDKWQKAADLWQAIHSTLARSPRDVWLGNGWHISLEIVQQAGDTLAFYLWTPRPLAQTLTDQFRAAYPGLEVEVQTAKAEGGMEDYFDALPENTPLVWADLGSGSSFWLPLRTDFVADPLGSLLAAVAGVGEGNALSAIHIILRPVTGNWQTGAEKYVRKLRGDNVKPGQPRPRLTTAQRAQIKQIEAKIRQPAYDLCLRVASAGQGDIRADLDRMTRAFDQFAADNRLTVRTSGSQKEWYRLRGRFFPAGWKRSLVSSAELAAFAHLPAGTLTAIPLARAGVQILRPSPVSFVQPGDRRVVLGMFADVPAFANRLDPVNYPLTPLRKLLVGDTSTNNQPDSNLKPETGNADIGIPLIDARRHFHVIGPTGVGKSTLLLRMIWQYTEHFPDAAVWLQEPHQDLTHKVVMRVPLWREKDVIWLDVMDPERAIGVNPLDAPADADPGVVVSDVMGVIKKVMGASWDTAVQMQEILENALLAILHGEKNPTLLHLFKILTDADYRFDLTAQLTDPIAISYWQSMEMKKERELDQMMSVPRRRVNAFIRNNIVRRITAQPRNTVDFRHAIDTGKIILVQLDNRMGNNNRTFIGAMMMYKLFGTVMSRMDIPEKERKQVAICVDEFQTFIGQSGEEFADILEQARKMGASLTLAHQHLGQLAQSGGDLINSVANNTGTKVVFRSEASDAPTFRRWLPDIKSIEALTKMQNYRCYVRPMVNGSPQPVCTLRTYADPPLPDPQQELKHGRRGEPDPLPSHPGNDALRELAHIRNLPSDRARKDYLSKLDAAGWEAYRAARRYFDAERRNKLIEHPELIPNKMTRIRTLVRLGYGTPHYETEAMVETILKN